MLTEFPRVDTGAYVRHFYGVPAEKGMRVVVDGKPGVIAGFDGYAEPVRCHPTWRVQYEIEASR
jgi:hypothetical protein